jgi:hypothetical protein
MSFGIAGHHYYFSRALDPAPYRKRKQSCNNSMRGALSEHGARDGVWYAGDADEVCSPAHQIYVLL